MAAFCPRARTRTRGLTRSFVMTGEVRLFEEGALNLPGAATMAAGGSVELWPVRGGPAGPMSPKCVRTSSVSGNVAIAEVMGAGRGSGDRPLARMANARNVSGLHRLREVLSWPEVTGAGCEAEGRCLRGISGDAEAPGSSGLPGVREVRFWLRWFAVGAVVGWERVGVRGVAFAGKCRWSRRHIEASVPVCGSFAKSLSVGLFARQFSATRFQKGDDVRGEGAPEIEAVILIAIPPKHRRHTIKNRAACFAGW